MGKKGIKIWILSTVTFASLAHTTDAAMALISNNQPQLPKISPLIGEYLAQIPANLYMYISAAITVAMWGLTCIVALNSPRENLPNKKMAKARVRKEIEQQVAEEHDDFFTLTYETEEESKLELRQTRDPVLNLRAEIKDMQKMNVTFEETRAELADLKEELSRLEEKMISPLLCKACGRPLRADFNICPYCGLETNIREAGIVCELDSSRSMEEQPKGCQHCFGYLSQNKKKEPIPQECVECKKAVECILNQYYSSKAAVAEIKKWY